MVKWHFLSKTTKATNYTSAEKNYQRTKKKKKKKKKKIKKKKKEKKKKPCSESLKGEDIFSYKNILRFSVVLFFVFRCPRTLWAMVIVS